MGTYTDFDVAVDTRGIPDTITVERPLLLGLGSTVLKKHIESIYINNDTVAVVDPAAALVDIEKMQRTILANLSPYTHAFEDFLTATKKIFEQVVHPLLVPGMMEQDQTLGVIKGISAIYNPQKSTRELRYQVQKMTLDNMSFSRVVIPFALLGESDTSIKARAAGLLREQIKSQLGWIPWLLTSKESYAQTQAIAALTDDEEFLTKLREEFQRSRLQNIVVQTSGPGALLLSLFEKQYATPSEIDTDIAPSSFQHYGLNTVFKSANTIELHTPQAKSMKTMNSGVGEINDLSWLQEGQQAIQVREKKIEQAATTMQRFFRSNKSRAELNLAQNFNVIYHKIHAQVAKIDAHLRGYFWFYKQGQKSKEMEILKTMLSCFADDGKSFDVDQIKATIDTLRTPDTQDTETDALVSELELFCKQAKLFGLTEEGSITLPAAKK